MNFFKDIVIAIVLTGLPLAAGAQVVNRDSLRAARKAGRQLAKNEAKAEKLQRKALTRTPQESDVVYVFGVAFNFNDSVAYMTEIQPVKRMRLEEKTKFLPYRSDFSMQLRVYVEGTLGHVHETTCVFYDKKRSKLAKRFYKMKKRYLDDGSKRLILVDSSQFHFEKPEFENVVL